jgi:hypothetical protein
VEEKQILPLQILNNCSGKSVYWGFFLIFIGSFSLGASWISNPFEFLKCFTSPLVFNPLEEIQTLLSFPYI